MIINGSEADIQTSKTTVETIIEFLNASTHRFWPTGSRYIGFHKPDSDWDFICKRADGMIHFLETHGFAPMTEDEYDCAEELLETTVYERICDDGKIQIQACVIPEIRVWTRDIIKGHFAVQHRDMNKEERREFWATLGRAYIQANLKNYRSPKDMPF